MINPEGAVHCSTPYEYHYTKNNVATFAADQPGEYRIRLDGHLVFPDIVDPTGITQSLLRRRSTDLAPRLDLADFHGLRLQHYRFFDAYQPLPERLPDLSQSVQPTERRRGLDEAALALRTHPVSRRRPRRPEYPLCRDVLGILLSERGRRRDLDEVRRAFQRVCRRRQ